MKKNVAGQTIGAQMVSATDGSAFTGSVTCYVCGDAGTQAVGSVGSGACTHEGNGYHTYAPAQAETNYDLIAFTFIGSGAVPATVQVFTSYPLTGDAFARLGAPAGASVSADVAAAKADTAAILADTGTDGVKIHPTQGAVTFGQVKILASAPGEGALHIVNSVSASSGRGMYVEGGQAGTMNFAAEDSGIGLRNRAEGAYSFGQSNEGSGVNSIGQYNSGASAQIYGNITGSVSSVGSNGIDTATLSSGALNAIADAVLKRDWTAVTGEASRSLLNALRFLRNKWSISGSTLTVTKEDDATTAWTAALSTDAAADPVTGSDPA